MTQTAFTRATLVASLLIVGTCSAVIRADENAPDNAAPIDLKTTWKRVVEVNRGWLDPRPESLSYKVVSGSPPLTPPEATQFVWVSGEKARWEMESLHAEKRLDYTLILTPERTEYIRGPEALLKKPLEKRRLGLLRQAISWHTPVHALFQRGLPDDAKVISDAPDAKDGSRIVVIETTVANERSQIGLGLYHVFYGSVQRPVGRIKLTLRLPDHVPLRVDLADGSWFEYGPEYSKVGNGLVPNSLGYITELTKGQTWKLSAQFQVVEGVWLLKTAQNIQNDVVVKQMDVQDVSTLPIADDKFALPERN